MSYHGHFANALGSLERRCKGEPALSPPNRRRTAWAQLVLRVWKVDPELCPRCGVKMLRSRALLERHEWTRLLTHLAIGRYPARPPPAAVPSTAPITYGAVGRRVKSRPNELEAAKAPVPDLPVEPDDISQIPPGWEDWPAAG